MSLAGSVLAVALAVTPQAAAWTWASPPPVDGEEVDPEGEYGARIRWDGEHVALLEDDLVTGGVGNTTRTLTVFTLGTETAEGNDTVRATHDWWRLGDVVERQVDVGMFANLPDVSYSLSDWAMGNERCPLDYEGIPTSTERCFAFQGWMGGLNSTHFPPQSHGAWSWYHQLALETGARCVEMVEAMDGLNYDSGSEYGALLDEFAAECETEALIFEAIAHHYLQDAWSSGHIWQRWGSPDPADWRAYEEVCDSCGVWHALAVGSMSGIIHGHTSVTGIPDPLCSPHPDVVFVPGGATAADGGNIVGDYNIADMTAEQITHLRACTRGSLDEVARVLEPIGQIGVADGGNPAPTQEDCFDQRVTNEGYVVGLFATLGADPEEVVSTIRWLGRLSFILPPEVELAGQLFIEGLSRVFAEEATALAILSDASRWRSLHDPDGTDLAEGELHTEEGTVDMRFLGMSRNGWYTPGMDEGLLVFDPPADVIAGTTEPANDKQAEDAEALRGTFHRAHADYWCENFDADSDDEDSDLSELRASCQQSSDPWARTAACDACLEMGLRFHRVGESNADYEEDQQPLCHAIAPAETFLYLPVEEGQTRRDTVEAWCSSKPAWAMSDNTVWRFDTAGSAGDLASSATDTAWLDDGPKGMAASTDRAFVSTTAGDLVVVTADGLTYSFGGAECVTPRGLAYDADEEVVYVACDSNDVVASYDASNTVPTFLDSFDVSDVNGEIGERPVAVALHPSGGEIAVATYETRAQKDGVTLISVAAGEFIAGEHVDIDLQSYDTSTDPWSEYVGAFFANSAGVAYANEDTLVVSNFGRIECLGSGASSCSNRSSYWVTLVDRDLQIATAETPVNGRTTGVTALWDDLTAVAVYGNTEVAIIAADDDELPTSTIDIGEYGADSIAVDADTRRIFVALSAGAGTCGLAIIDASDPDPDVWEVEAVDTSLYCVRAVAVP
jgi:hypothetical protein